MPASNVNLNFGQRAEKFRPAASPDTVVLRNLTEVWCSAARRVLWPQYQDVTGSVEVNFSGTFTTIDCAVTPLVVGDVVNGALTADDCTSLWLGSWNYGDVYSFSGVAGQQIAIDVTSGAFYTGLVLFSEPDGGWLGSSTGPTHSRIPATSGVITLPATGTYLIEVIAYYQGQTGAYTLTLGLAIRTTALNPGRSGAPLVPQQLTADSGPPPFLWSVVGALPAGLTLSPDGVLSGTPMEAGCFPITFTVTDADNTVVEKTLTLGVLLPQPLQLNKDLVGHIGGTFCHAEVWEFSAVAGQQVRLRGVHSTGSGPAFDLAGPDGWSGFTNLKTDSDLVTLPAAGTYRITVRDPSELGAVMYGFRLEETTVTDINSGSTTTTWGSSPAGSLRPAATSSTSTIHSATGSMSPTTAS